MFRIIAIAALLSFAAPAVPAYAQLGIYDGTCSGSIFNFLPRIVRKDAVAAIGPDAHVTVREYCRHLQLNDLGNAAGLTRTIANNPTLLTALRRHGWVPDDVVGINVHGNNVDLYVHRY
jgi:hypothetical protein